MMQKFQLVISKTPSVFPARKLRSIPGFPHILLRKTSHARLALHTVFSTTQLELLKKHNASCHHGIRDAYSVGIKFDKVTEKKGGGTRL